MKIGLIINKTEVKCVKSMNVSWSEFKDRKIFITGGAGFVGLNLIEKLVQHKIKPYVTDILEIDNDFIKNYDICFYKNDITNRDETLSILKKIQPDFIIHLASMTDLQKNFKNVYRAVDINIKGTLHILEYCSKNKVNKLIFLSTSDIYGGIKPPFKEDQLSHPASPYSVTKLSAENFILLYGKIYNIPFTILRCFNLYGKYQKTNRLIPYIIDKLSKNEKVELTEGKQKREFNHIENLLDAINLTLKNKKSNGEIINIGNGESISKEENLIFGAKPYRQNEIWDMYCDNTKAKKILGWFPRISLDKGLELLKLLYETEE